MRCTDVRHPDCNLTCHMQLLLAGITELVAGSGVAGFKDGSSTRPGINEHGIVFEGEVQFNGPTGIAVTADGETAYVTDRENHRIRK